MPNDQKDTTVLDKVVIRISRNNLNEMKVYTIEAAVCEIAGYIRSDRYESVSAVALALVRAGNLWTDFYTYTVEHVHTSEVRR